MQNKKQAAIEVQGGEIGITNQHGDIAIIPIKDKKKVELLIATGKHDLVDKYLNTLPKLSNYASDGTVIPKDKMMNITQPDGSVKQVGYSSPEYKALYDSGKLMNYDKATDTYTAPMLKEVVITAKKDPKYKPYTRQQFITDRTGALGNLTDPNNMPADMENQYQAALNDIAAKKVLDRLPKLEDPNKRLKWLENFTPAERKVVEASKYAYTLEPTGMQKFENVVGGLGTAGVEFKSEGTTQAEAKQNAMNPLNMLEPTNIPGKLVQAGLMKDYTAKQAWQATSNGAGLTADLLSDFAAFGAYGLGEMAVDQVGKRVTAAAIDELGAKYLPNAYKAISSNTAEKTFTNGGLKNVIPGSNPEFIQRGVGTKEAIDDLLSTGVVRNRQSAGLASKNRWGEKVYWGEKGSALASNEYNIIAKNSKGLNKRAVTADDIVDIQVRQPDGTYKSLENWKEKINKPHWRKGYTKPEAAVEELAAKTESTLGQQTDEITNTVAPKSRVQIEEITPPTNDFNVNGFSNASPAQYREMRRQLLENPALLTSIDNTSLNNILNSATVHEYRRNSAQFANTGELLSGDQIRDMITTYNRNSATNRAATVTPTDWGISTTPTMPPKKAEFFERVNKELSTGLFQDDKSFKIQVEPMSKTDPTNMNLITYKIGPDGSKVQAGYINIQSKELKYMPPVDAKIHPDFKPGETIKVQEKIMDYPSRDLQYEKVTNTKGIGASTGEAIKRALKHFDQGLVSSDSHTLSGGARYLAGFLNDRGYILDLNGNEAWYQAAKELKAANPGKKWTTKEIVKRATLDSDFYFKYHPKGVRFFYTSTGGTVVLGGGFVKNYLDQQQNKTQ